MSVLIKGFEMPKDGCKDCAMVKRGKVFDICPFLKKEVNGNVERGGKPNGCPLVDVPDRNVGDMISRKAAIDLMCRALHHNYEEGYAVTQMLALPSAQPEPEEFEWCTDCKEYDQESHCCHRWTKVIRNTVEEIKNTQPEPRWIPVTESLPEIGKRVLITLVNGYPWVRTAWYGTLMFKNKVCFYESDSEWGACEISGVTAWMPLPKPYERSEDASNEG